MPYRVVNITLDESLSADKLSIFSAVLFCVASIFFGGRLRRRGLAGPCSPRRAVDGGQTGAACPGPGRWSQMHTVLFALLPLWGSNLVEFAQVVSTAFGVNSLLCSLFKIAFVRSRACFGTIPPRPHAVCHARMEYQAWEYQAYSFSVPSSWHADWACNPTFFLVVYARFTSPGRRRPGAGRRRPRYS